MATARSKPARALSPDEQGFFEHLIGEKLQPGRIFDPVNWHAWKSCRRILLCMLHQNFGCGQPPIYTTNQKTDDDPEQTLCYNSAAVNPGFEPSEDDTRFCHSSTINNCWFRVHVSWLQAHGSQPMIKGGRHGSSAPPSGPGPGRLGHEP